MMICRDCGFVFEGYDIMDLCDPDDEEYMTHVNYMNCPNCAGDDIVSASTCERCGEFVALSKTSDGLCPKCQEEVMENFSEYWEQLSIAERDYIYENFKW